MPDIDRWPMGRLLSTAARLVEYGWNEKLEAIGLTHAGVIALEVLSVNGSLTQTQLAQLVRVQAQTMGMTLSRLEAHGHISRQPSISDRRRYVVSLTRRGREAVDEAAAMEQAVLAEASIDPEALRQELQAIVRGLAPGPPRPVPPPIATAAESGLAMHANNPS